MIIELEEGKKIPKHSIKIKYLPFTMATVTIIMCAMTYIVAVAKGEVVPFPYTTIT